MYLVDLLSFCSETCLWQAYPKKMLLPNPITSSSFDWFFCSWGLRTLGRGENSSWGYISSGPRSYCYSWVLILTQCLALPECPFGSPEILYFWPKNPKLLTVMEVVFLGSMNLKWGDCQMRWGTRDSPSSRPQEQENVGTSVIQKGPHVRKLLGADPLTMCGQGLLKIFIHPVTTHTSFWKPPYCSKQKHFVIKNTGNILEGFKIHKKLKYKIIIYKWSWSALRLLCYQKKV